MKTEQLDRPESSSEVPGVEIVHHVSSGGSVRKTVRLVCGCRELSHQDGFVHSVVSRGVDQRTLGAPAAGPGVSVELDKVHNSQVSLAGLDETLVRVMVEPGLVNWVVPGYPGGGQAAPGARRHQSLPVLSVDGVRHPVVEAEDSPDGDVGPAPAGTPGPALALSGPVQVGQVKTGLGVCLAGRRGTFRLVHHLPEPQGRVRLQLPHHRHQDGVQVARQLAVVPEQVDGLLVPEDSSIEENQSSQNVVLGTLVQERSQIGEETVGRVSSHHVTVVIVERTHVSLNMDPDSDKVTPSSRYTCQLRSPPKYLTMTILTT